MKISKIERVSKNKALYHLYIHEDLLMTVTENTLLHFNLQKGLELSDSLQQKIYDFDQTQRCLEQAYRYLSRRNHFRKELQRKLRTKGYDYSRIEKTLETLKQKGYLDDNALMIQYINDAIRLKQYGPNLIKQKLLERGLDGVAIDMALQEQYPSALQQETCQILAEKKLKTLQKFETQKTKQKLAAFLQQRGFTWHAIQPILENLFSE